MAQKAQVKTCELRGHGKKKFTNPFDIDVTSPQLWHQFWKNQKFWFFGPKGTGPDL